MAGPAASRGLVLSRPAIEGFFSGLAKAGAPTQLALAATTAIAKPANHPRRNEGGGGSDVMARP